MYRELLDFLNAAAVGGESLLYSRQNKTLKPGVSRPTVGDCWPRATRGLVVEARKFQKERVCVCEGGGVTSSAVVNCYSETAIFLS